MTDEDLSFVIQQKTSEEKKLPQKRNSLGLSSEFVASEMSELGDDAGEVFIKMFPLDDDTLWQPSEKIPIVLKAIEQMKLDLKIFLTESNFDVAKLPEESSALAHESEELLHELESCKEEIVLETMTEILDSIQEHDIIASQLKQVNYSLNIMYYIRVCVRSYEEYEDCRKHRMFLRAAEELDTIKEYLSTPADGFQALAIFSSIGSALASQNEDFVQQLSEEFDKMIYCEHQSDNRRQTYNLNFYIQNEPTSMDVFQALIKLKHLKAKIGDFAQFLLKKILIPVIHCHSTVSIESDDVITIDIFEEFPRKPEFVVIIEHLRFIFQFLRDKLNIQIDKSDTLLSLIGKEICEEFGDVLIRDCLMLTIPSSVQEMKQYGRVSSQVECLETFLTTIRFFPKENFSIMQYENNLDVLFADKTSQSFLSQAREIMLKDLSSSMSIGVEAVTALEEKSAQVEDNVEEALDLLDRALPKSLFFFPRCMISRSAQELVDLVHVMMEQAAQCSDVVFRRLYTTARLIFELYDAVVPYHHENFLLTIPQYVALFHNNCMYLAHNLLTLGEKWCMQLNGRELGYPLSFLDLVPALRGLAHKHLTAHMQQQRKQILDNIRSSDLNCIVVKDVLGTDAEQAVRQCLRQLQLLKNVWIGVFPPNVFRRLMACLVNMFVEELIHRVCTVEDISAEMATQLTEIYTIVVKKAPNLFTNESELEELVKCWVKLQELILVLGGSLKDIEKRWGDGAGPLAIHFRVEELRSLIKALFQNTQFRANLLSKIK